MESGHDAPTIPTLPGAAATAVGRVGPYTIVEKLGEGGYGAVYRATHPLLGEVALKVLRRAGAADLVRFAREGSLVLHHPGIPRILDHGEADGEAYLAQEIAPGKPLARLIEDGPLPEREAVRIARGIAEVLAHAHARDVIHRDLKPANVLCDGDHVSVLDFGIARIHGLPDADPAAVSGTPAFMAPEQAQGIAVGPPADMYALGVVLYLLLSGRLPITAATSLELLAAVVTRPPVPLGRVRHGAAPALQDLTARLLSKYPAARPGAAEVALALGAIEDGLDGGGPLAPLHRAAAGHGSILLITGAGHLSEVQRLMRDAPLLGISARSTEAAPEDGPFAALARTLGASPQLPQRPSRTELRRVYLALLRQSSRAAPLLLHLGRADLLDDGTLDLVLSVAPALSQAPVVLLLSTPSADAFPTPWLDGLDATGALTRRTAGEPQAAAPPPEPDLSADELEHQAVEAKRLWAPGLAARRLRALLRVQDLAPHRRLRALVELGSLEREAGNPSAASNLDLAVALSRELGDDHHEARALRERGILRLDAGTLAEARADLDRAMDLAARTGDARLAAGCTNSAGVSRYRMGELDCAITLFERALTTFRAAGLAQESGPCLGNLAVAYLSLDRLRDARECQEAALAIYKATGDEPHEAVALVNLGNVLMELGERGAARACYEKAIAIRRRLQDAAGLLRALSNLASLMAADGELEAALAAIGEVHRTALALGSAAGLAIAHEQEGVLRERLGQLPEARSCYEEAVRWHREARQPASAGTNLRMLAMLAHQEGHAEEADRLLGEAAAIAVETREPILALMVESDQAHLAAERGEPGAVPALERVSAAAERRGSTEIALTARLRLARALRESDPDRARELVRKAADLARARGLRDHLEDALRLWETLGGAGS